MAGLSGNQVRGGSWSLRRCLMVVFVLLGITSAITPSRGGAITVVNGCGTVSGNAVWTPNNLYVINQCNVTIPAGTSLTIQAGTIVKVAGSHDKVIVNGALYLAGTEMAPVVVTSLRDDTWGGDTNGDGATTQPSPGDWGWILFNPGSRGTIESAILRFGGVGNHGYTAWAMVKLYEGAQVSLDRTRLEASWGDALYGEKASAVVTRCQFIIPGGDSGVYSLNFDGLSPDSPMELSDSEFITENARGRAARIKLDGHPEQIVMHGNSARGTGWNGLVLEGTLHGDLVLDVADSMPLILESSVTVPAGAGLTLTPGTVFKPVGCGGKLFVDGSMVAKGTVDHPIVFTSLKDDSRGGDTNGDGNDTSPTPSDWGYVRFRAGSVGVVDHVFFEYGGVACSGYDIYAPFQTIGATVDVRNSTFDTYRWDGIYSSESSLTIRNSRFPSSPGTMAVRNAGKQLWVDARHNWWGAASGPQHPTLNPTGEGSAVSDRVRFLPWAIDESGTEVTQVQLLGPTRVSPGDTAEYALHYYIASPLEDAVVLVHLPWMADYVDGTGGAVEWPERNQVFWRLGHVDSGAEGTQSLRVRYAWGLDNGSVDNVLVQVAGSNDPGDVEIADYLAYQPRLIVSERLLSEAELNAEIQSSNELRTLYQEALNEGYLAPRGSHTTTSKGETISEILLIHPSAGAARLLHHMDNTVLAITYDRDGFRTHDTQGGWRWDQSTDQFSSWGAWDEPVVMRQGGSGGQVLSFTRCFFNCVAGKVPMWIIKKKVKLVGALFNLNHCFVCGVSRGKNVEACAKCENAIKPLFHVDGMPVLGQTIDITKCAAQCAGQQGVVYPCKTDLLSCDSSVTRGVWQKIFEQCSYRRIPCRDGVLKPDESYVVNSGCSADFCKCVEGQGCVRCGSGGGGGEVSSDLLARVMPEQTCDSMDGSGGASSAACRIARTNIRVARDPNAKVGLHGDLLPGQPVTYTITYENEGEGRAYGVFVTDELAEEFDDSTLVLHGDTAQYIASVRMILWTVGELAPKGEPGSKGEVSFSVSLRSGLPDGTVITNQAIVYFPSVPEETPTNTVVNTVQSLVAVPQSVETNYGQPVAITLSGAGVDDNPLSYAIKEGPLNGNLTGSAPSLTYMPDGNFTGMDRFAFSVSDGATESRPADVTILVKPAATDRVPPEVRWTSPEDNAVLVGVPAKPPLSDELGPRYAPLVRVGFSEALDPATVVPANIALLDSAGSPVATTVGWDGVMNEAVIVPREPWRRTSYVIAVGPGITDASGNALASGVESTFRIDSLAVSCIGDCNGDGEVTIDELLKGVNIALGTATMSICPPFDANGDGEVTIDEIIAAVNAALFGC